MKNHWQAGARAAERHSCCQKCDLSSKEKEIFFPLSFYLTFLALSIDHPPKPAGIEKCTLKRFGGGARRTSRSPQGQDEHGHN